MPNKMASAIATAKIGDPDGPEVLSGVAIVSHLAALLRARGPEALEWIRQELAAGRLKTAGGVQPFVMGPGPTAVAGVAPASFAKWKFFSDSGLHVIDQLGAGEGSPESGAGDLEGLANRAEMGGAPQSQRGVRRIFEAAERGGSTFLVAMELPLVSEAERLRTAAAELWRMRMIVVLIYVIVWIAISFHVIHTFSVSPWLFAGIGAVGAVLLHFQITEAVGLESEVALFERLRLILASVSGVFASFIIFASASPAVHARPLTTEVLLLGLFVSFSTFAINPRLIQKSTLTWANSLMRAAITIGVSAIAVALYMGSFRHLGAHF